MISPIAALLSVFQVTLSYSSPYTSSSFSSDPQTLLFAGQPRGYQLYVPSRPQREPLALMVVLHGGLGNGSQAERSTGMSAVAEAHGFIVVYPEGTPGRLKLMQRMKTWNAGVCCGPAAEQKVDDVGFLRAVVEDVSRQYPVDRRRIYITGLSNGAMMAYRMACEAPDLVAAIVPVAGTLTVDSCAGGNPVAVLHIHGEQDDNVPLAGGVGKKAISGVAYRSVWETLAMVSKARDCKQPEIHRQADGQLYSYACRAGAPVFLRLVTDGTHAWPGASPRHFNGNFSGSEAAWDFARQYQRDVR